MEHLQNLRKKIERSTSREYSSCDKERKLLITERKDWCLDDDSPEWDETDTESSEDDVKEMYTIQRKIPVVKPNLVKDRIKRFSITEIEQKDLRVLNKSMKSYDSDSGLDRLKDKYVGDNNRPLVGSNLVSDRIKVFNMGKGNNLNRLPGNKQREKCTTNDIILNDYYHDIFESITTVPFILVTLYCCFNIIYDVFNFMYY